MTEWADRVCRVAVGRLDMDGAAITLRAGQAQDLVAATDRWAQSLEELQYTAGEGPGVEAFSEGTAVLVADVAQGLPRWPGFTEGAAAVGAGAAFAFPLRGGPAVLGALGLYRHEPGPLTLREVELATLLADMATAALFAVNPMADDHYADVNVATGMLAAHLEVPVAEAFLRLRAVSFQRDRSVLDVARDVVAGRLRLDGSE